MDSSEITFIFQFGSMRDGCTIPTDSLTLKTLKESARNFINNKIPNNGLTHLFERILLFRHDYNTTNILQIINSASEVVDETLVEIVITGNSLLLPSIHKVRFRSHQLNVQSYKVPTFCDFCGEMLFGLVRQGLKCDGCGQNYHKRCAIKVPNNCNRSNEGNNTSTTNTLENFIPEVEHQQKETESFLSLNKNPPQLLSMGDSTNRTTTELLNNKIERHDKRITSHTFEVRTYGVPTVCQYCKKLLKGLFKQGLQCRYCHYNVHKKCLEKVPENCFTGNSHNIEISSPTADKSSSSSGSYAPLVIEDLNTFKEDINGTNLNVNANLADSNDEKFFNTIVQNEDNFPSTETRLKNLRVTNSASNNIPLMRIVQSVKHTKKRSDEILKEGWLIYFTNLDKTIKKHFWRLDSKTITLFVSEQGSKYYKEIQLDNIRSIQTNSNVCPSRNYCFEIETLDLTYYCGLGTCVDLSANETICVDGLETDNEKSWETSIKQAYMHVLNKQYCESEQNVHDMGQLYEIFSDDVLGSGQFGVVYGGTHKKSKRKVAIKVIDKLRFPTKQETQLKNEVAILQNISHYGVVNLEGMFETPERIFVVMEKLKGDMLEMILSHENGRLDERVTKFLITQILIALKHLHSQNIVHCDLKPENVLLSSNSAFPQVKLCDFGYARIIGEKSFRRSVVGTPAYLAPEVLRNKCYNRSLDMWSVGVIIYVSLSGTFPFNEEEDINDQIQNAAFMYPPKPWKEISSTAIDLINNLLQVKQRKRYTVDKSLQHYWLQDKQTYSDLRTLEIQVGARYLTHETDDIRWSAMGEN